MILKCLRALRYFHRAPLRRAALQSVFVGLLYKWSFWENIKPLCSRRSLKTGLPEKWERILKWEPIPQRPNPKIAEIDWGRSRFRSRKNLIFFRGKTYYFFSRQSDGTEKKCIFVFEIVVSSLDNFFLEYSYFFPRSKAASTPIYFCNFGVRV